MSEGAENPTYPPTPSGGTPEEQEWDPELIPDLGPDVHTDWPDITGFIKATVPIRTVYTNFVPKAGGIGRPVSGGKETFIRCPSPAHVDKRPSAWMQEREGLWYCAACAVGGDLFDLAAHATGHRVPDYKANAVEFGEVVQDVASRLGVTEEAARAAGYTRESRPAEEADVSTEWPEDFTDSELAYAQTLYESWDEAGVPNAKELAVHDVLARREVAGRDAEVKELAGPELDEGVSREIDIALTKMAPVITAETSSTYEDAVAKGLIVEVGIDPESHPVRWEDFLDPETPVYKMMKAAAVTDIPDEFVLWSIYTALGTLVGRRVELIDYERPVDPAFWTVLVGDTGTKKSTIAMEMEKILHKVAPPSGSDGVKLMGTPASGERFMDMLRREEVVGVGVGVEAIECTNSASFMYVDEYSLLASTLGRAGNTLGSHFLQVYGAGRDQIVRPTEAMGRISFPVTGPLLGLLSTTQPNRLSTMMDRYDIASGFMNRFGFIGGSPRRVYMPMAGYSPDWGRVREQFQIIQNRLNCADIFIPMHDKAFVDKPWQLVPDSGGLIRLREWIIEQRELMATEENQTIVEMLARRDLIIKKLVLVMAINRIVGAGTTRVPKNWTAEDVDAAIGHYDNLRHGWMTSAEKVFETVDTEMEDWVIRRVNESTDTRGIAQRDLLRLVPHRMRMPAKDFNQLVQALATAGAFRQVDLRRVKSKKSTKWLMPNSIEEGEAPGEVE
jgi:hypothetical protein